RRSGLIEIVVGVVSGVAVEFPCLTVELLSAALDAEADGRAWGNSILGGIVTGEHFKLRNGILRGHDVHAAGASTVISFAPVDQPDIVVLVQAVDAEGEVRGHRCRSVVV